MPSDARTSAHTTLAGLAAVRQRRTETGRHRVRTDGKFFVRGGRRLRVQGVTYGPFAPGPDGEPFPNPGRVADDFTRMRAAGIQAVRTYHLPPEWFLDARKDPLD